MHGCDCQATASSMDTALETQQVVMSRVAYAVELEQQCGFNLAHRYKQL